MKTFLIADDDSDVAQALARAVRCLGDHHVLVAYSGTQALELLRTHAVDVLLSDIDMPGMSGVELAAQAKSESLSPVRILITGNARLDTAMAAINSGEVHRYLTKPWQLEQLLQTLEESLSRLDELTRAGVADRVVRRLRAAQAALEAEFPGITKVERDGEMYVPDPQSISSGLRALEGSMLATLVSDARSRT